MNKKPFGQSMGPLPTAIGNAHPRLPAFKHNAVNESINSKLVSSVIPTSRARDGKMQPPSMLAQHVVNKTAANIIDNENMLQLLPDMELAMQVLISSILSPNNLMSCELAFTSTADDLGDAKAHLLETIRAYFIDTYKINSFLPEMLEDILFKKGSYPLAVLPESSIDEAINGQSRMTTESFKLDIKDNKLTSMGILANQASSDTFYGFGMESIGEHQATYDPVTRVGSETVIITDNINLLKFPKAHDKMVYDRVQAAYSRREMGLEARGDQMMTDGSTASLYQYKAFGYTPVVAMRTLAELEKPTVGHPLVLLFPAESIIPVHVPSEPRHHIGYYVAVDRHGNPIRANISADYFADFSQNTDMLKDMSTQLLAQTRRASEGRADNMELMINETMVMYAEVMERELRSRLVNGLYGENVEVSKPTEIYRIMFARACAKMQTQLLFIPTQLMTYMAFDYNHYGVGKSLLETTKILGSIRAMMLFANTMAAIKNSTNHVELTIDLDPEDPDPSRTVEVLVHEFAKARQSAYPIGASNPLDIVNYIQNAGIGVTTQGNPNYPETKLSVEDRQSNRAVIDTELDETLKKRHLMAIGIAPETVDLSMNVDFAQSVINSNILLAKRALVYQKMFTKHLSDFIHKFTQNSAVLMDRLRATVEANKASMQLPKDSKLGVDAIVLYFLRTVETNLPEPDLSRIEMQKTAYDAYSEALDAVLPAFVSSELFDSSVFGELSSSVDMTIAIIKAHYQRRWMQNNDMLPEVFEILEQDKDGKPTFDLLKNHEAYMDNIGKALVDFMKHALPAVVRRDAALNKVKEATGVTEEAPPVETPPDDGGGGDGTGGGESDDFDFGDTGGGEDDITEEEPVVVEPEAEEAPKDEKPAKEEPEDKSKEEPAKEEPEDKDAKDDTKKEQ